MLSVYYLSIRTVAAAAACVSALQQTCSGVCTMNTVDARPVAAATPSVSAQSSGTPTHACSGGGGLHPYARTAGNPAQLGGGGGWVN